MLLTKSLTAIIAALVIAAMVVLAINSTQSVSAQNTTDVCAGIDAATGGTGGCGDPDANQSTLTRIASAVTNILSIIVGAAAVIVLIISGLKFITSSGDSQGVQSARNGIIYALVGLVIVIFAQVIVRFVVSRTAGPATTGLHIERSIV